MNSLFKGVNLSWTSVRLNLLATTQFPQMEGENPLLDPKNCEKWIEKLTKVYRVGALYGGYMENRSHLWRGSYLTNPEKSFHLGVDVNYMVPMTPVVCPVDFKIEEIYNDADQQGGWGDRITVKVAEGYLVFAHLLAKHSLQQGATYPAGTELGFLAPPEQNGGWFTHLHIQGLQNLGLLKNLDGYGERNEYLYPNPLRLLGFV